MNPVQLKRLFKDVLSDEEMRCLRICGLAIKAWERERGKRYGVEFAANGEKIGPDPIEPLVSWAFGDSHTIPSLVKNYGPPVDSTLEQLEEWMLLKHCPWFKDDPKVKKEAKIRAAKDVLLATQGPVVDDDVLLIEVEVPKPPDDDVPF